MESQVGDKL